MSSGNRRRQGDRPCTYPVIVAATADVPTGDREPVPAEGMDDLLAKPVDTQELDEIIGRRTAGLESRKA